MRLMQRLAISGLLSVILILLLTGTLVTRRDLASVIVDRGVAPEERNEQVNPAWMQDNMVPGQDEPEVQNRDNEKDRRLDKPKQFESSAVEPPAASTPGIYVIRPPNPPLDDVTNQRREKVKEMMKHGWDNYVRYAWGKNELRPISKRGHSASIFGASNMGATIVDGLDTLYIMGLHDEFKQGRDWIAENLDFDIVKQLFDQIRHDWNLIRNIDELNIIRKYAYKARFYTIFSGSIVYPGTLAFILTMFIPGILDIITPLDEPRPRKLPAQIECFLDQEKYFYIISIVFTICAFLGMTVLMATETMYMIFIQHACGLFELISYRLTDAFDTCSSRMVPFKTKCNFYIKLLGAFNIHQHCLEFLENIQAKFALSYFVLCGFGVASLSINMFRLFLAMATYNVYEVILTGLFVYAHFCYVFWMNYFGQDIIDHSEWFFQQICNIQWYTAPLHIQKLLLIALQRSMKNSKLIIGSLFVASLEGFATLTSMSLSYCMVIYSVRV